MEKSLSMRTWNEYKISNDAIIREREHGLCYEQELVIVIG